MSSSLEDNWRSHAMSSGEYRSDKIVHALFGWLASAKNITEIMKHLPQEHPLRYKIQKIIDDNGYVWNEAMR